MTDTVDRVAEILKNSARYPWKTAKYLRRRLVEEGTPITTVELEAKLLEHAATGNRVVRYSFFPARKSLDLLWGHVDVVNDPGNLPDPHLEARVNVLESGAPPDPAATMLSDLFVAGLGQGVPPDRRVVVLEPFPAAPPGAGFHTFEEEFPELT